MTPAIGDIINGTYRIERLLGEGGMARVYEVSHSRLPKKFALKIILRQDSTSADFLQRFRREAEVLAKLRHPHIVEVIDWNKTPDGLPYLVLEYLEGEDLARFLARSGVLQPEVALAIIYQIGQALQFSHDAGIIHRDLKPSNIFIDANGAFPNFVKVLDFGIAKVLSQVHGLHTQARACMGTPAYMSPEQAAGLTREVAGCSDQFALGVLLYEMLSGQNPFSLPSDSPTLAQLARVVSHEPPPLRLVRIGPAVQRAMSKQPALRFPSIRDFLDALGARRSFGQLVVSASLDASLSELTTLSAPLLPRPTPKLHNAMVLVSGLLLISTLSADLPAPPRHPVLGLPPYTKVQPKTLSIASLPAGPMCAAPPLSLLEECAAPLAPPRSALPETPWQGTTLRCIPPLVRGRGPVKAPPVPQVRSGRSSPPVGDPAGPSLVTLQGGDAAQQQLIKECWDREVRTAKDLPHSYQITLQRAGSLHVTDAPDAVRQTDFDRCLRKTFQERSIPQSVTILVRGGR